MGLERKLKHRKLKRKYQEDSWRVSVYPSKLSIHVYSSDLNKLVCQYNPANWYIFLDKKSVVIYNGCHGIKHMLYQLGNWIKKISYISSCFLPPL